MNVRLPQYPFKRGKSYSVRYSIPTEYRSLIGKKEIVRGLGTLDLSEAISKRDETIIQITQAMRRGKVPSNQTSPYAKQMATRAS